MPSGVFKPYAGLGWTCGACFYKVFYYNVICQIFERNKS